MFSHGTKALDFVPHFLSVVLKNPFKATWRKHFLFSFLHWSETRGIKWRLSFTYGILISFTVKSCFSPLKVTATMCRILMWWIQSKEEEQVKQNMNTFDFNQPPLDTKIFFNWYSNAMKHYITVQADDGGDLQVRIFDARELIDAYVIYGLITLQSNFLELLLDWPQWLPHISCHQNCWLESTFPKMTKYS